jgi:hypothetical protein
VPFIERSDGYGHIALAVDDLDAFLGPFRPPAA